MSHHHHLTPGPREEEDEEGETACSHPSAVADLLHVAVARNSPDLLRELLATRTLSPDAPAPRSGLAPLHLAAWGGSVGMVVSLLVHGADADGTEKRTGWTALHMAARQGHEDVTAALVEAGADARRRDRFGLSALDYAVIGGNVAIVRFLLERGMDPNDAPARSPAPLLVASARGNAEMVRLLLYYKASHQARDEHGRTPLSLAVRSGHRGVAELLLAHGADVHAVDREGSTALHEAVKLLRQSKVSYTDVAWSLIELLLRAGADVEAKNHAEVSPHMLSAQRGVQDRLLALARQYRRRTATSVVCLSVIGLATSFVMLSRLRG